MLPALESHLSTLVRKELIRPDQPTFAERRRVSLPSLAHPRRRLRVAAEGDPSGVARAVRGLAGPARAHRAGRDSRLPPGAGATLPRGARCGRRRHPRPLRSCGRAPRLGREGRSRSRRLQCGSRAVAAAPAQSLRPTTSGASPWRRTSLSALRESGEHFEGRAVLVAARGASDPVTRALVALQEAMCGTRGRERHGTGRAARAAGAGTGCPRGGRPRRGARPLLVGCGSRVLVRAAGPPRPRWAASGRSPTSREPGNTGLKTRFRPGSSRRTSKGRLPSGRRSNWWTRSVAASTARSRTRGRHPASACFWRCRGRSIVRGSLPAAAVKAYLDAGLFMTAGGLSMLEAAVEFRAGDAGSEERVLREGLELLGRIGDRAYYPNRRDARRTVSLRPRALRRSRSAV